jgi:hypothetical protein
MGETSYTVVKAQALTTGTALAVTSIPKHKCLYISNTGAATAVVTVKGMKPDGTATDSFVLNVPDDTTFFVPFRIYEITSLTGANISIAFLM